MRDKSGLGSVGSKGLKMWIVFGSGSGRCNGGLVLSKDSLHFCQKLWQ